MSYHTDAMGKFVKRYYYTPDCIVTYLNSIIVLTMYVNINEFLILECTRVLLINKITENIRPALKLLLIYFYYIHIFRFRIYGENVHCMGLNDYHIIIIKCWP